MHLVSNDKIGLEAEPLPYKKLVAVKIRIYEDEFIHCHIELLSYTEASFAFCMTDNIGTI